MKTNKIAIIICYFGPLPWYTDYFLHSCGYNSTIDFFFITDDAAYAGPFPPNVHVIIHSLSDISRLATDKLGMPVNIKQGYKLCDFKPAYGTIFSHLLNGYDFWGHSDLDIILGDIRSFYTDELLNDHDLLSCRADWLTGCFLLYKNTEKVTGLYKQSKDYAKVFMNDAHYCFDETNFAHDAFTAGKNYLEVPTEIESMMHVVQKLQARNELNVHFEHYIIEGRPGRLSWDHGKMFYRKKYEILLYHLIFFKTRYKRRRMAGVPPRFTISQTRIYHQLKG